MSGSNSNPWAWLGLLKWSLAYSDGTTDSPSGGTAVPMSEEDRKFLESVMKDGIIDENERMKIILKDVTTKMELWKSTTDATTNTTNTPPSIESIEDVEILLQELRDIVEQIDYARAFAAMNGISFLLGCVQEVVDVPKSIRIVCLGIIATMCQNNPPVQKKLLELSSIKILSDLFFTTTNSSNSNSNSTDNDDNTNDTNGNVRARTIQAISANVRSYELAENVFVQLEQSTYLIECGLGMNSDNIDDIPNTIKMRTVFLLQALLSSNTLSTDNSIKFVPYFTYCIDTFLYNNVTEGNYDLMEMVLCMIEQMLENMHNNTNTKSVIALILEKKEFLNTMASHRITTISNMIGDEREFFGREYDLWENINDLIRTAELLSLSSAGAGAGGVDDTLSDDEGPSDDDDDDDL